MSSAYDKRRLIEEYLRFRVKPPKDKDTSLYHTPNSRQIVNRLDEGAQSSVGYSIQDLNTLRTMANDRDTQYSIYDEMEKDSIIASALDMYADDSTQYDTNRRRLWVECNVNGDEGEVIRKSIEYWIKILRIEDNCWDHIRALCKYGDLYLETFREGEKKSEISTGGTNIYKSSEEGQLDEYIEAWDDPSVVFDLIEKDRSAGYVVVPSQMSTNTTNPTYSGYNCTRLDSNTTKIYGPDKFIHITLRKSTTRNPETVILNLYNPSTQKVEESIYKTRRGKSILHDIYKAYQELSLLEDSLLLNRLNKSAIVRLLQVEVGDSPKSQVQLILRRLKEMIEQKMVINKNSNEVKSIASPGPVENIVYVPTRNGKGVINSQTLGGDVDVKSILDIEYYANKVFGGLKIPKSYLGQESSGEGGLNGGTSLAKKDSRYARTIKAIQSAYLAGITEVINQFLIDRGLTNYIGKYELRMVSPSTIEDSERDESLSTRLDVVSKLMDLLSSLDRTDELSSNCLSSALSTYISEFSDLASMITNAYTESQSDENDDTDSDEDFGGDDDDMSFDTPPDADWGDEGDSMNESTPPKKRKPIPKEVADSINDFGSDFNPMF